jgi:hypothetical protein
LHAGRVRVGQDQRECVIGAGLDRRVDIDVDVALIEEPRRPLAALPPDMTDAAFLADARFILEIQANPLVFMGMLNFFEKFSGSF